MVVPDVAMLAADTARSRIYLQIMIKNGLCPARCVVFSSMSSGGQSDVRTGAQTCGIDLSESLEDILLRGEIPCEWVNEKDINSPTMAEAISGIKEKHIIYSGYGGAILKAHLFRLGKKFLHVHAGLLPRYRGSTTAYYSILKESFLGATAIFLNESIDQGDVLYKESFSLPDFPVDIDYIYEPWVRAQVLVKTLQRYVDDGCVFHAEKQSIEDAETYYIIHPVLKHLAMWKVEEAQQQGI